MSPGGVFVTRLHVRYDAAHFPEDLVFQATADRTSFQGRYVVRHAWKGETSCFAGWQYLQSLRRRNEQEVETLSSLTGWPIQEIRKKAGLPSADGRTWWQRLFQ